MMRNRMKTGLVACAATASVVASLGATLLAPNAAFADIKYREVNGTEGTTEVSVGIDRSSNVIFSVPTSIPFVASPDGKLIGPSSDEVAIKNLSAFPIHITNIKAKSIGGWTLVNDVSDAEHDAKFNLIDFKIGRVGSPESAYAASQGDGIDTCNNLGYVLSSKGLSGDALKLETSGHIRSMTPAVVNGAAQVTWTVEAGRQHERA